jgi:hypothetical protein
MKTCELQISSNLLGNPGSCKGIIRIIGKVGRKRSWGLNIDWM